MRIPRIDLAECLAVFELSVAKLFKNLITEPSRISLIILMRKLDTGSNLVLLSVGQRVFKTLHIMNANKLVPRVGGLSTQAFSLLVHVAVEIAESVSVDKIAISKDSIVAKLLL